MPQIALGRRATVRATEDIERLAGEFPAERGGSPATGHGAGLRLHRIEAVAPPQQPRESPCRHRGAPAIARPPLAPCHVNGGVHAFEQAPGHHVFEYADWIAVIGLTVVVHKSAPRRVRRRLLTSTPLWVDLGSRLNHTSIV